jgi:glycosyltransferase involved in cell wall biosynthesis
LISCVILTLNEEDLLAGCLESLQWCDDVHVLDSGSTDSTRDIATSRGAQVTVRSQHPRFIISDQRNWALANITFAHDWVLFIDADERCTPDFVRAVKEELAAARYDAYYLAPKFIYQGTWLRKTKGYPNWEPRLAKARTTPYVGGVWESFSGDAPAGYIAVPYLHFPNAHGLSSWIEKHVRYALWDADRAAGLVESSERRTAARSFLDRLGRLRPWAVILATYFVRGSYLDGRAARSYRRRILIYELMIQEARLEQRRLASLALTSLDVEYNEVPHAGVRTRVVARRRGTNGGVGWGRKRTE